MNEMPLDTPHFDTIVWRDRLIKSVERSPHRSVRQASVASGMSVGHLQKWVSGHYDDSTTGPGAFKVANVCRALNITPNYLLGFDEEPKPAAAKGPSIEDVMSCYVRSGKRLEGFEEVINYCDIYKEPKNGKARLERLGPLSLQSLVTRKNAETLQKEYELSDPEMVKAIYHRHKKTWDDGKLIEDAYIDRRMIAAPVHARFDYVYCGFRVSTLTGQERLVVFTKKLS